MTPYEQYEKDVRHQGRTTHSLRMAAEFARLGKQVGFTIVNSHAISNYFKIVRDFEKNYHTIVPRGPLLTGLSTYNNVVFDPITATITYRDQYLKEIGSIEFIMTPRIGKTYFRIFEDDALTDLEIQELYKHNNIPLYTAMPITQQMAPIIVSAGEATQTPTGETGGPSGFKFL
jgi:hypothetical protein